MGLRTLRVVGALGSGEKGMTGTGRVVKGFKQLSWYVGNMTAKIVACVKIPPCMLQKQKKDGKCTWHLGRHRYQE